MLTNRNCKMAYVLAYWLHKTFNGCNVIRMFVAFTGISRLTVEGVLQEDPLRLLPCLQVLD